MSTKPQDTDNIPAPDIQKEGENVTGGSETSSEETTTEDSSTPDAQKEGSEYTPNTETTKEEMTGYNELPEQEKVGGE